MNNVENPMDSDLVSLLACPACWSEDLTLGDSLLTCAACSAEYPIRKGIPYMLPAHLADALRLKDSWANKRGAQEREEPGNSEIDRFMWEHHLYFRAVDMIYTDPGAAALYASYAESGAESLCRLLKEKAGGVHGKTMLYVGSGNDRLVSLPLQEEGAFVVNLDIAAEPLEGLLHAGARNCVCGDARQIPFRAGSFDVVFSKGSIHHSHPIDMPLRAMARVLKLGGHIVVVEPSKNILSHLFRFIPTPGFKRTFSPYEDAIPASEVVKILHEQGIRDLEVGVHRYSLPMIPEWVVGLWDSLARAMPWLFGRFAFEFAVCGRKNDYAA